MTEARARSSQGLYDELRRIVPTEQIAPEDAAGEAADGVGSWAVEPAAQMELVDLLEWSNLRHAAVFTRRPRRGDAERMGARPRIYLRAHRMRRVKDVDPLSGTVTVQCGITMAELQRVLGERSFTTGFPTRPWRQESLGSVLAAALDAHWGPRYGAMEQEVLGLGVVFPDGSVATSRGAPRKAVGPDFDRLFLGSRGRYGIMYEATLRIYPSANQEVLSYGAADLTTALHSVRRALDAGLDPRAVEILTPAPDRSWGKKRVGLTPELPVLVLVEPWGPLGGRPTDWVDAQFAGALERLSPPVGWNVHEGLLPQPRAWTAPVVGVRWATLMALAAELGDQAPAGLWIVRLSRQGAWLSLAQGVEGASADTVRALVDKLLPVRPTPWQAVHDRLKAQLDPKGILNPES